MKNVIVTGANGFIGSSLIKKLVEKKVNIVALDISFAKSRLPESEYVHKIEVDMNSINKLNNYIPKDKYDVFYHLAWTGVNGQDKANPIVQLQNIEMTINCATAAKELGCGKFLCAGTIAERATESINHLSKTSGGMMYGVAKHSTHLFLETYCKNIGLDFVWMQFSNIYGPNNKTGNLVSYTVGEIIKGNEAHFGPANQPYDFIYVDDLIEAVLRLGEYETRGNCYFIGSGEPRILKEYLFEIGEVFGRQELVKVGLRPDDGIVYTMDMFDTKLLREDIGDYVTRNFSEGIRYTIENY